MKFSTIYCSIDSWTNTENIVGTIRFVESLWLGEWQDHKPKSFCWVSDTNAIIDRFTNVDRNRIAIFRRGILRSFLFHSSKAEPLKEIPITTTGNGNWNWSKVIWNCPRLITRISRRCLCPGYYQEDVVTNAVNYTSFNWDKGVCGGMIHIWVFGDQYKRISTFINLCPVGTICERKCLICKSDVYQWSIVRIEFRVTVRCDLFGFFSSKTNSSKTVGVEGSSPILNDEIQSTN
jgi:hypothetical protein